MVEQYPHYLFVKEQSSESTQDTDGNWVTSGQSWSFHSKCREETNGAGRQINGVDGKAIVFSSTVYMPKGTEKIVEGTEILVTSEDSENGPKRVQGIILKYDSNQFNCKLWV